MKNIFQKYLKDLYFIFNLSLKKEGLIMFCNNSESRFQKLIDPSDCQNISCLKSFQLQESMNKNQVGIML